MRSGKYFGCLIAAMSMIVAPLLAGQDSIFTYLQTMNGIYNIPICAVVLVGLLSKRTPAIAAKIALLGGVIIIALGVLAFPEAVNYLFGGQWHFFGVVFVLLIAVMLFFAYAFPRPTPWVHEDSGEVDLTPWKYVVPCGIALLVVVVLIYAFFADFSVLSQSTRWLRRRLLPKRWCRSNKSTGPEFQLSRGTISAAGGEFSKKSSFSICFSRNADYSIKYHEAW